MTKFQLLSIMISFGALLATIIFGLLSLFIAILNLLK